MWQPQGEEQVMGSAVVAREKQKRRWLWWIGGLKTHMQWQEKNVLARGDAVRAVIVNGFVLDETT